MQCVFSWYLFFFFILLIHTGSGTNTSIRTFYYYYICSLSFIRLRFYLFFNVREQCAHKWNEILYHHIGCKQCPTTVNGFCQATHANEYCWMNVARAHIAPQRQMHWTNANVVRGLGHAICYNPLPRTRDSLDLLITFNPCMARRVKGFRCTSMRNHSVVISISSVQNFMFAVCTMAMSFRMHAAHLMPWHPLRVRVCAQEFWWICKIVTRRRRHHNPIICIHKYCCLQSMCSRETIFYNNKELWRRHTCAFTDYVFQEIRGAHQFTLAVMKMSCMSHLYCCWKLQSIIFLFDALWKNSPTPTTKSKMTCHPYKQSVLNFGWCVRSRVAAWPILEKMRKKI